ncbi:MAG: ABC transporter ATP-binding protein/permease, partial [Bacteroidales bacterium]|nr:ABC transporter ATP-binding protein/permease [Bacteroidales bacterium]
REAPYRPASIVNNLVSFLRGGVSLVLMGGLLAGLNWLLEVILLVANIPGVWLRLHFSDKLYNFRKEVTPEARRTAYFNWILTGDRPSREVRLFGLGDYFIKRFRDSFSRQKEEEISIVKRRTSVEFMSALFKGAAVFVTLYYIVRETALSSITIGDMAMYLLAFRLGMTFIKQLLGSVAGLYEDNLFMTDIFDFLDLKEKVIAVPPVINPTGFNDGIVIEDLSFSYPGGDRKAISNVSFEVKRGETIALVGPNGAGKTTLVRLLCRLYDPDEGDVLFDGKNIINSDPAVYRKLFSVVFQDFMLYNITAGENILLGNIKDPADRKMLEDVAKRVGIDELLSGLPKGYDTVIGRLFDDSRELSWGEWQKIALARALYRQSPILVLDEPASALDAASEYDLFTKFHEITKDRTSILISHRFSNVAIADRIIVLDRGEIIESGSHAELIKMSGVYKTMYDQQKSRYL